MKSFIRLRQRRNVLLPQPDGPMIAVISLRADVEADAVDRAVRAVVDGGVADLEHDLGRFRGGQLGGARSPGKR